MSTDQLTRYYLQQGKGSEEDHFYRASFPIQRGRGFWSNLLGSVWRTAKPLLSSGAKAISRQALSTGSQILNDLSTKSPDQSTSTIIKTRLKEGKHNLVNQAQTALKNMAGAGLRRRRRGASTKRGKTRVPSVQKGGGKKKKKTATKGQTGKGIKRRHGAARRQSRVHRKRSSTHLGDIFD